ncbi:MAG TPA: beta-L-arabinofuranosidase domain-containing protein [Verrucomicrobiae bacterium]|nr:beta-L-arabinofuranosidase domain-containing protein [Verrucomicrobiae bacterium]
MASAAVAGGVAFGAGTSDAGAASPGKVVLQSFDFVGVKLRPSRWQKQYADARDFYLSLSNDDILHGFRAEAGLSAPGKPLGGWLNKNSYETFGQWLMAMARASRVNDDQALRDKASLLVTEWGKTIHNTPIRHYAFEKMIGGLVDMHLYAAHPKALEFLENITDYAIANLNRARVPAQNLTVRLTQGDPLEWYTLAENLYRAYQATGKEKYREFAEVWLYPQYWEKFITSSNPTDVHGFHAYSHLNTFSSAAMAYAVSGDPKYLQAIRHGYDFFQNVQCYATGGYGPAEKLMPDDGALGDSLEERIDNFETPCGTWAGFKLSQYLMRFTGEARYGDWIETLFYNGIGSALPITTGGRNFYYSSYALGSALKAYDQSNFTCCSGTYFQDVTEYHNLIYLRDSEALYVNLYVPSEVTWKVGNTEVRLVQDTHYPESEITSLKLELTGGVRFPLKFRVPQWASDVAVKVNGVEQQVAAKAGEWAVLERAWQNGDNVEIRIPLKLRRVPVDKQHPDRVAVMRGPVVLAQEAQHDPLPAIPGNDEALISYFKPAENRSGVFYAQDDLPARGAFRPFYTFGEGERYHIYFDPKLRRQLW